MNNSPIHLYKHRNTAAVFALSLVLIGCGEGIKNNPVGNQQEVKTMLLNDTGVKYFIDNNNQPYALMVPKKDTANKNILSIFNNYVTNLGEVYTLKPVLDANNNPVLDAQGAPRTQAEFRLDQNGNRVIEEIAMVQKTDDNGSLVFETGPLIYTNNANEFPDEPNVIQSLPTAFPAQDANFGRDVQPGTNANNDGKAGFQFTKLNKDTGAPLLPDDPNFGCVKDEVTGLTWENKVNRNLEHLSTYHKLHKSNARHTWFNPDSFTNGGNAGQAASQTACATVENDVQNFIKAVNTEKLCGISNWRLPTIEEMRSIIDYSVKDGSFANPMTDQKYFPYIADIDHRWTSQSFGSDGERAFGFHFYEGRVQAHQKSCTVDIKNSSGETTFNGNQSSYHNGTVLVSGVYQ